MKNFLSFVLFILVLFSSCKSSQTSKSSELSGAKMENAIVVKSISQEYEYIDRHCPGCQVIQQSLIFVKQKPFDVLEVRKPNGESVEYYFDISSFYGKW